MAYAALAALLILLVLEHDITKQLLSCVWNFILRPMKTLRKVQYASDDSAEDLKDSSDETIGDHSSSIETKAEAKLVMEKVSKYYGRRLAVDQMSLNIER